MRIAITTLLLFAGFVNLAPVVGVLSAERLHALYGVPLNDPNLVIAMRHRAVLLGIVGALLVAAAFQPGLRPAAFIAGLVSMLSFVVLAFLEGEANALLRRIAWVDVVAALGLVVAAALHVYRARALDS